MEMDKKKVKDYGEPTGNSKVIISQTLFGKNVVGKSVGFTVYEITPEKLRTLIIRLLKEHRLREKDKETGGD